MEPETDGRKVQYECICQRRNTQPSLTQQCFLRDAFPAVQPHYKQPEPCHWAVTGRFMSGRCNELLFTTNKVDGGTRSQMMPRSSRGRDEAPRAGLWASSRRRHTHALMGESQRSMKQVKGAIAVQWITARALTKALTSNAEKEEETFGRRGRYLINMKRRVSDKRAHLLL